MNQVLDKKLVYFMMWICVASMYDVALWVCAYYATLTATKVVMSLCGVGVTASIIFGIIVFIKQKSCKNTTVKQISGA
jgi:hypothetical protein